MSSRPLSIVGLAGSLRRSSFNRALLRAAVDLAPPGLALAAFDLIDVPLYNGDVEADGDPASVVELKEAIAAADGVLFVTPEYNRGVPGVLKNAIDVGSRPYGSSVWNAKPAAIVSASPGAIGGFGANHQLRQACVFLNMPVMQQPEAYLGHVNDDSFDGDGCLKDGGLKDLVEKLAHALHDWVDMIHRSRAALAIH